MKLILKNKKMKVFSLSIVLMSMLLGGVFMQSCDSEFDNADILSNNRQNITEFEKVYANSLSSNDKKIKVIGFKTVYVPENEREDLKKFVSEYKKFVSELNCLWIEEDYSFYRIYFALHTAIVECDGKEYMADEKGLINTSIKDITHLDVLGRKRSETVCGTGKNIILEDRILFRDKLTQASKKEPMKGYTIKGNNICVFDLGERKIQSHHDHCGLVRLKSGSETGNEDDNDGIGCYQNHGNQTCSNAFGIHGGRCTYLPGVCMDYNGTGTNCVNSSTNFIGSDCFYAMANLHCWNEIMQ